MNTVWKLASSFVATANTAAKNSNVVPTPSVHPESKVVTAPVITTPGVNEGSSGVTVVISNKKYAQLGSHPIDVLPLPVADLCVANSKQIDECCVEFVNAEQETLGYVLEHYIPAVAETRKQVDVQAFQMACGEFRKTFDAGEQFSVLVEI
jgi:hypothetical protein